MRTVLAVTIALALYAPAAALAAPANVPAGLDQMVSAYQQVQAVRVVERFENGAVATVDVLPSGQYRIASTGGQDPVLIVQLATHPVPNLSDTKAPFSTKSLGTRMLDNHVKVQGYTVAKTDGSYTATMWVNQNNLPVTGTVQTQGHKVSLQFGDYNNSMLIGAR